MGKTWKGSLWNGRFSPGSRMLGFWHGPSIRLRPSIPWRSSLYANENGYLDAMILTARGDEFKEERQAWLKEDPEALERYRKWFVDTFGREPPGLR